MKRNRKVEQGSRIMETNEKKNKNRKRGRSHTLGVTCAHGGVVNTCNCSLLAM